VTLAVTAVAIAIASLLVARGRRAPTAARPWWASPLVWLGAGVAISALGLIVVPRLLGFAFLFLPLLWLGGRRRSQGPRDRDA
jgi:hypothetical protein